MEKKEANQMDTGVKVLLICGIIAVILIIACVFFRDQIFGLFF